MRSGNSIFRGAELTTLSDHLFSIHSAPDIVELARRSIELVRRFIDADTVGYAVCDPRREYVVGLWWPQDVPVQRYTLSLRHNSHQHPMLRYWQRTRLFDQVLVRSECCEERAFRNTEMYNEFFRPLSFKYQLGAWCRYGNGHHVEVGLNRTSRDFSRRDRERLQI